jgi:hypothetical protein
MGTSRARIKADPKAICMQAENFLIASRVLVHHLGATFDMRLVIPDMIVRAFCTECYLKCAITLEKGSYSQGHNLMAFFNQLSDPTRARLAAYNEKFCSFSPTVKATQQQAPHVKHDIVSLINAAKDAFTLMRYSFEGRALPKDFGFGLDPVIFALRRYLLDVQPDWKSFVQGWPPGTPDCLTR